MSENKPAPKKAAKKTASKKVAAKKVASKKVAAKKSARKKAAGSGFSLDDALAIAQTRGAEDEKKKANVDAKEKARKALEEAEQKAEKRSLGAASLADILGYNPAQPAAKPTRDEKEVPAKYMKFYKLLVELRDHVKDGLNAHTEETLKRSSKDDAGDLSGYSQHMADAGTDTFDRDFALSMVSNEQEALTEIEEAIERIFNGTYGICAMTGKQIRDERLMAVPFTRYSIKTQEQIEKNTFKVANRGGGAFADASSEDSLNFGEDADEN